MRRLIALLSVVCVFSAATASPEFFSREPYEQAKALAAKQEKLFFVKGTAEWCGPCKMMDRTTFKDKRVIEWLTSHAVSVAVDVDKQPKIAQLLRIRAMPTMILFRGDEELGRAVGYRDAGKLLAWLESASTGKQKSAPLPEPTDIQGRMDHARDLYFNGDFEKATEEYVWLWKHMLEYDPTMLGVRSSFMAADMSRLAEESPHARAAFAALRDETEKRLKTGPRTWDDLGDWLVLNEDVLHDRKPVLAWIDRIKDRPNGRHTLERFDYLVDDILIDEGRWTLYGELISSPETKMWEATSLYQMSVRMAEDNLRNGDGKRAGDNALVQHAAEEYRDSAGRVHAALLAAGRDDEAWAVADRAVQLLDDAKTRRALVETAIKAGQAREKHLELLDTAAPENADLIREVRAATGG
ncbi:MAG TPA: thioredoxin [Phycisphaerales bacterium]|nr:thioredoxin [Phycisphaerales bacterium]